MNEYESKALSAVILGFLTFVIIGGTIGLVLTFGATFLRLFGIL